MSVHQLDSMHLAALIGSAEFYDPTHRWGVIEFNQLAAENARSVAASYMEDVAPKSVLPLASAYAFYVCNPLPLVDCLKALQCYEHNSDGARDWHKSTAARVCAQLQTVFIRALPGYEDAEWSIGDAAPVVDTAPALRLVGSSS